jgi:hypothetical protein
VDSCSDVSIRFEPVSIMLFKTMEIAKRFALVHTNFSVSLERSGHAVNLKVASRGRRETLKNHPIDTVTSP